MQHITKLCADSLRTFTNDQYGIKLKASHAHEFVAALLGYKTNAALVTDTQHPIGNLAQAKFIVFDPSHTDYANRRYVDLGYTHPTAGQLAEHVCLTIRNEKSLSAKFRHSFREIAIEVAKARLPERFDMWRIAPDSIDWDIDGHLLHFLDNGDAKLEALVSYMSATGERLRDSSYLIHVPLIAANLGYGTPQVEETRYTGLARKIGS